MEREAFAEIIHWTWIMSIFAILNPCLMLPQLIKIWVERVAQGVSVTTIWLLIFIQAGFAMHGFFIRDGMVLWSNVAAAFVSIFVLFSTLFFRRRN